MLAPSFSAYSLALIHQGTIVHSSRGRGIMPLVACLEECRPRYANCILHDKIIGLAAAKLAAYSGVVSSVVAGTASESAADFLEDKGIPLEAGTIAANILTADRSAVCPGEIIAETAEDYETLVAKLREMLAG
jgi:hypothetical protein